jgi:hypothetical protein
LALAWPVAYASMLAIIYVLFGGKSSVVGRHLYPVLVACVIGLAAGALVALGRRWGTVVLLAVLAVALQLEVGHVDRYLVATSTGQAQPGQIVTVDQSLADHSQHGGRVVVRPPCRADLFALVFSGEPAKTVAVHGAVDASVGLSGVLRPPSLYTIGLYRLPAATAASFEVAVPASSVLNVASRDLTPRLALAGQRGDPAGRVYCPRGERGNEAQFDQAFGLDHASWHPYRAIRAWPRVWAAIGWMLLVLALAWAARSVRTDGRRSPRRGPS